MEKQIKINTKRRIGKVITTVVAFKLLLTLGASFAVKGAQMSKDSNLEQITTIAQELNCDMSSILNNTFKVPTVMSHNGGEPIYVHIDDSLPSEHRDSAKWATDYLFGIVGDINPKYRYELVDKDTLTQKALLQKTTIDFSYERTDYQKDLQRHTNAQVKRYPDILSYGLQKPAHKNFEIVYDSILNQGCTPRDIDATMLHELMHAFGFDDVYNMTAYSTHIKKFCGNTFMNVYVRNAGVAITPNDYKCLVSMYAEKMNQDKLFEFIAHYKQKVEEYSNDYYQFYSDVCQEKTKTESILDTTKSYSVDGKKQFDNGEQIIVENYHIDVADGLYRFVITDEKGNVLEKAEGEVVDCGTTFVLKEVRFQKGHRPLTFTDYQGYVNDFVLMKKPNGQIVLYNAAENDDTYCTEVVRNIEK